MIEFSVNFFCLCVAKHIVFSVGESDCEQTRARPSCCRFVGDISHFIPVDELVGFNFYLLHDEVYIVSVPQAP